MGNSEDQCKRNQGGKNRRKKKQGRKRRKEKKKEKKKNQKKGKMIEVRKVVEEWEIWDEEEEAVKSEAEAKKLVLEKFHK